MRFHCSGVDHAPIPIRGFPFVPCGVKGRKIRQISCRLRDMATRQAANELYQAKRYAEAEKAYAKLLEDDNLDASEKAKLHANRAAALAMVLKIKDAAQAAAAALAWDPAYERAKSRLSKYITKLGSFDDAIQGVNDAAAKGATDEVANQLKILAEGRVHGNAAFSAGDYAAAIEKYSSAIDSVGVDQPGAGLLLCNRAACHSKLGNHQRALDDAELAIKSDDDYVKAIMRKATALDGLGMRDKATETWSVLRWFLPNDPTVRAALMKEGRKKGAAHASLSDGPWHLTTFDDFKECLQKAKGLVVVDFTASWCGPCKQVAPVFVNMAKDAGNASVLFLKVDVDEVEDAARFANVRSMPTFVFYRVGQGEVQRFSGADPVRLNALVSQLR